MAKYWNCIILRRERPDQPATVTGATVHFLDGTKSSVDCSEARRTVIPWIPALITDNDADVDWDLGFGAHENSTDRLTGCDGLERVCWPHLDTITREVSEAQWDGLANQADADQHAEQFRDNIDHAEHAYWSDTEARWGEIAADSDTL